MADFDEFNNYRHQDLQLILFKRLSSPFKALFDKN